jgi:hypothetical protein
VDDQWVALGVDRDSLDALHEGIPPWMASRFWPWVGAAVDALVKTNGGTRELLCAEYDERRRLARPLAPRARSYGLDYVLKERNDDALTLSFVDFLIAKLGKVQGTSWPGRLEDVLQRSGSAWRVGQREGCAGLERRVALGAQEAAEELMSRAGDAGKLLSEAWHAAFGIDPDPDKAYKKAILAVEAAGAPVVSQADKKNTLGKMASVMRDQGWGLPLQEDADNPSKDVLWKMCRALVSGETARHGANGYRPSTQEEAEAAVFLAVPLVQFFHSGSATKRK